MRHSASNENSPSYRARVCQCKRRAAAATARIPFWEKSVARNTFSPKRARRGAGCTAPRKLRCPYTSPAQAVSDCPRARAGFWGESSCGPRRGPRRRSSRFSLTGRAEAQVVFPFRSPADWTVSRSYGPTDRGGLRPRWVWKRTWGRARAAQREAWSALFTDAARVEHSGPAIAVGVIPWGAPSRQGSREGD